MVLSLLVFVFKNALVATRIVLYTSYNYYDGTETKKCIVTMAYRFKVHTLKVCETTIFFTQVQHKLYVHLDLTLLYWISMYSVYVSTVTSKVLNKGIV